ncbi:GIY-YIG nuclease family protein [Chloroflexota bacterium]
MTQQYYIYIITNEHNTVLYTGVTNDLERRIYEHKNKLVKGFTSRYNTDKLVYYEICEDIENAILREKQIKGWLRKRKNCLIELINPEWKDLSEEIYWNGMSF